MCNVQSGSKKKPWVLAPAGAFRGREREEVKEARARGEKLRQKKGRDAEEKKEEGEEDEGSVEKAFRVGVARWASRLPRRECG